MQSKDMNRRRHCSAVQRLRTSTSFARLAMGYRMRTELSREKFCGDSLRRAIEYPGTYGGGSLRRLSNPKEGSSSRSFLKNPSIRW